ncbi:hypothetical protein JF76_07420 [Lactobacillus kullabergensis]|uniref:Uncharacterized protein n=1 Tax=Lactobacillus kullabergensis TaxID=1218493 RepID=A0A0F4LC18_9LACO|nr:hypothetical protein [Lactobacillus kullabergensis]KJY56135.1 hypothetical protein JF76_07420 [Lactobacillus kullabergensis]
MSSLLVKKFLIFISKNWFPIVIPAVISALLSYFVSVRANAQIARNQNSRQRELENSRTFEKLYDLLLSMYRNINHLNIIMEFFPSGDLPATAIKRISESEKELDKEISEFSELVNLNPSLFKEGKRKILVELVDEFMKDDKEYLKVATGKSNQVSLEKSKVSMLDTLDYLELEKEYYLYKFLK